MANYLVTGACGFTGSHCVDVLLEAGESVRATDLPSADRKYVSDKAEFIAADITDPSTLDAVVDGVDYVLHPAAIFKFSASKELLDAVNVEGTKNLCRAAMKAGVKKLVSWSSSGVYGQPGPECVPINEHTRKKPVEKYGKSKLDQDRAVFHFYRHEGFPVSIVRPGVVYGPRCVYGMGQIFTMMAKFPLPVMPLPMNFKFRMATVHARDVSRAAYHVSTRKEADGEEYGVVDPSGVTYSQALQFVAVASGLTTIPFYAPVSISGRVGRSSAKLIEFVCKKVMKIEPLIEQGALEYFPVDLLVDTSKLQALGFKFEYPDFQQGAAEAVAWYRENGFART